MSERHLLADVGGTNTRVGLADARGLLPDSVRIYENAGFDGLAPLLAAYLCETEPGPIDALCAGVAGPVRDGDAQLTNHDWFIAAADLAAATGAARVRLINDLQAQGYALDDVPPAARVPLFDGAPPPPTPPASCSASGRAAMSPWSTRAAVGSSCHPPNPATRRFRIWRTRRPAP